MRYGGGGMKNWKVSTKIRVALAIVVNLTLCVMAFGVYGMYKMNTASINLYENNMVAVEVLGNVRANVQAQCVRLRDLVLYEKNTESYKKAMSELVHLEGQMDEELGKYEVTIDDDEDASKYLRFVELYNNGFKTSKSAILRNITTGSRDDAFSQLTYSNDLIDEMNENISTSYQINLAAAEQTAASNNELFYYYMWIMVTLIVITIALAFLVALLLTRMIAKPLETLIVAANTVALGNTEVDIPDYGKDEVGTLAGAFRNVADRIASQADTLTAISHGDLSLGTNLSSERDVVGIALEATSASLNRIVREVMSMSSQVAIGATQVSEGSQSLAQGSAEQATVVEQLSASIYEISLNTKENAKMAAQAAELYADMKKRAQEGSQLMSDMMRAVQEINDASASIAKIIKLINDISFQTNILSLNAAVEAANAGQHGKGFAVVASEVRNLAAKSSDAAKDTDQLIENSLDKARLGQAIAGKTFESLNQIVESVMHSAQLIDDIAKASSEQSLGVEQINVGIEQVAQVINLNTATAEKSAMAAEEMAAQAGAMERMVSNFKLRENAANTPVPEAPHFQARTQRSKPVISLDEGFGKY